MDIFAIRDRVYCVLSNAGVHVLHGLVSWRTDESVAKLDFWVMEQIMSLIIK